tara:strand:+ start:231 stop:542 length:312 start_codon:yes stop_codon:yes gene_type:complete
LSNGYTTKENNKMSDYGTVLRTKKTRSVSGASNAMLVRFFQDGKFWYIEALPMGTKDKVGFDWGVYAQLYKRPTETGSLALTGKTKNVGEENSYGRKNKRNTK